MNGPIKGASDLCLFSCHTITEGTLHPTRSPGGHFEGAMAAYRLPRSIEAALSIARMPALIASVRSGQAATTAPIFPRSPPGVSLALKNGETKTPGRVIPGASRPRSRTSQGQEPYTGVIDLTLAGT